MPDALDDCGVCTLIPSVSGVVRAAQVSCPVHGNGSRTDQGSNTMVIEHNHPSGEGCTVRCLAQVDQASICERWDDDRCECVEPCDPAAEVPTTEGDQHART